MSKITVNFLEDQGFYVSEAKPTETLLKDKSGNIKCIIGKNGYFSITENCWIDEEPIKTFSTINPNLTEHDYREILRISNITIQPKGLRIKTKS